MRICMVIPLLVCSEEGVFSGGHVNSMLRLVKGLSKEGHQICVVAGVSNPTVERLGKLNLPRATFSPLRIKRQPHTLAYSLEFLVRAILLIRRLRKTAGLDIIHIHSGYPYYGFLGTFARQILKIPSIYTLYCPITSQIADHAHSVLNRRLARWALLGIDSVIAISQNVKISLQEVGISEEGVDVIPPPIDLERFSQNCNGTAFKQQLGNASPILLFVGNLTKTKGLEILLEAMPSVISKYPLAKLIMALDVSEKQSAYELQRREKIYDKIDRIGIVANVDELGLVKDLPSLMAASDVVVAPFISTAGPADYPISVLEAMAVGRPVVATRVGGIAELIAPGKIGILVNPHDSEALAENILALLDDPARRKTLGDSAARFVAEHFELHNVARRVQEVYRRVTNPTRRE